MGDLHQSGVYELGGVGIKVYKVSMSQFNDSGRIVNTGYDSSGSDANGEGGDAVVWES